MFRINICTYNILNDHHAVKYRTFPGYREVDINGEKRITGNWRERRDLILKDLLSSGCDILCLQEVSWEAYTYLENCLKTTFFSIAGYSQHANTDSKDPSSHGNIIIYNRNAVDLLAKKIFFSLNDKHHLNSEGVRLSLARGEIYADFSCKKTQVKFRVANTHLKGYDRFTQDLQKKEQDRLVGFQELQEVIEEIELNAEGFDFLVVTGDLNEGFEEIESDFSRLQYLQIHGYFSDGNRSLSEPATDTKIDHIYIRPIKQNDGLMKLIPLNIEVSDVQSSDHLLVKTQVIKK